MREAWIQGLISGVEELLKTHRVMQVPVSQECNAVKLNQTLRLQARASSRAGHILPCGGRGQLPAGSAGLHIWAVWMDPLLCVAAVLRC